MESCALTQLSIHTSAAKQEPIMTAETILHNGKIATNGSPAFVEAVAIQDGKIVATGNN